MEAQPFHTPPPPCPRTERNSQMAGEKRQHSAPDVFSAVPGSSQSAAESKGVHNPLSPTLTSITFHLPLVTSNSPHPLSPHMVYSMSLSPCLPQSFQTFLFPQSFQLPVSLRHSQSQISCQLCTQFVQSDSHVFHIQNSPPMSLPSS